LGKIYGTQQTKGAFSLSACSNYQLKAFSGFNVHYLLPCFVCLTGKNCGCR